MLWGQRTFLWVGLGLLAGCGSSAATRAVRGSSSQQSASRVVAALDSAPASALTVGTHYACALIETGPICIGHHPYAGGPDPHRISELAGAVELAGACARFEDGTVRCGRSQDELTAPGMGGVRDLVSSQGRICVLADGGVYCGEPSDVQWISEAPRGVEVAMGEHSIGDRLVCVRTVQGAVRCWDGAQNELPVPGGLRGARGIVLGRRVACASRAGEPIACWTVDRSGGDACDTELREVPESREARFVLGSSCFRTARGELRCINLDADPCELRSEPPEAPLPVASAVELALGHSGCARDADGSVRCWGLEEYGLGRWAPGAIVEQAALTDADLDAWQEGGCHHDDVSRSACQAPAEPSEFAPGCSHEAGSLRCVLEEGSLRWDDVVEYSGGLRPCARFSDGALRCLREEDGWASFGESLRAWPDHRMPSSRPATTHPETPLPEPMLDVGRTVSHVGDASSGCAARGDGSVRCWTEGFTEDSAVRIPAIAPIDRLVSSGELFCGRTRERRVQCWRFDRGRALLPRDVGLDDVEQLVAADTHLCARRAAGDVHCWGSSALHTRWWGEHVRPQRAEGMEGATALATRGDVTCARAADGRVRCWAGARYGSPQRPVDDPLLLTLEEGGD